MPIDTTRPTAAAIPKNAACLAFQTAAVSLTLLVLLHFIKPEFAPSWRMVSEYAIGRHGWVMTLSFLSQALSCAALFVAIRSQVQTLVGKAGLGLLLIVAAALVVAGLFAIDPITSSKNALTTHGNIHALASMVGVPGLPVAAMLISTSLSRNPAWFSARKWVLWTANLTWISVAVMFATIAIQLPSHGQFGPDVWIGWPNRFIWVAYCAWLMMTAAQAAGLSQQR